MCFVDNIPNKHKSKKQACIHPTARPAGPSVGGKGLEPIRADLGQEAEFTLITSQSQRYYMKTDNPLTLESVIDLNCM